MIVSPKAAEAAGRDFGTRPVCAGPFRFVERVAQDRIVVERFPDYWDAGRIHINRITYQPIPDSTVRLANLQAGALEMVRDHHDLRTCRRIRRDRAAQLARVRRAGLPVHHHQHRQRRARADAHGPRPARARGLRAGARPRRRSTRSSTKACTRPRPRACRRPRPSTCAELKPPARNVARARALLREAGRPHAAAGGDDRAEQPRAAPGRRGDAGHAGGSRLRPADQRDGVRLLPAGSRSAASSRPTWSPGRAAWTRTATPGPSSTARAPQNDGKYSNPEVDRLLDAAREERRRREAPGALRPDVANRRGAGPPPDLPLAPQEPGRAHRAAPGASRRCRTG